ncbi:MAG: SDR family NAD(P)-dependent oxidoreductase [Chloroflexota bacterium]
MQKTYIVTGATSGIGLAVAEQLARQGAFVVGVGRDPERCALTEEQLKAAHPEARACCLVADLALQSQIRLLAAALWEELSARKILRLDGLVNNAGTFTFYQTLTAEGFEMQWAVNHLAPFLLTHLLLPLLQASSSARVVTVSSGSHYHTKLNWKDIQLRRHYNSLLAYKQTKLCNVLFTAELNRRFGLDSTVRAFAADPGLVFTELGFKNNPLLARWIWARRRQGGISPQESAGGVVFLATEPSIQDAIDIYWKHCQPKDPNPLALDPETATRLWNISARMCGIKPL